MWPIDRRIAHLLINLLIWFKKLSVFACSLSKHWVHHFRFILGSGDTKLHRIHTRLNVFTILFLFTFSHHRLVPFVLWVQAQIFNIMLLDGSWSFQHFLNLRFFWLLKFLLLLLKHSFESFCCSFLRSFWFLGINKSFGESAEVILRTF